MQSFAKILIVIGIILIIVGIIAYFTAGKFSWFGRLPGDIRIEKENFGFYFPLTSMILVSIILSLIATLLHKLIK